MENLALYFAWKQAGVAEQVVGPMELQLQRTLIGIVMARRLGEGFMLTIVASTEAERRTLEIEGVRCVAISLNITNRATVFQLLGILVQPRCHGITTMLH